MLLDSTNAVKPKVGGESLLFESTGQVFSFTNHGTNQKSEWLRCFLHDWRASLLAVDADLEIKVGCSR